MRSVEEILSIYEKASKDEPLVLGKDESENFRKAMQVLGDSIDSTKNTKINFWDKDICFRNDAVISPADGRAYANRREWDDMLKRNGCQQAESTPSKGLKGNYNCRKELTQATRQVFEKQGLR